jgi:hypothetical protein
VPKILVRILWALFFLAVTFGFVFAMM